MARELVADLIEARHAEVLAFEQFIARPPQQLADGRDAQTDHALAGANRQAQVGNRAHQHGLLVGGAGLCPNGGAFEPYVRAGCDLLIAGETDNYGFRYAAECGIPLIETSHELCEMPGFRHFSEMLAGEFADLDVTFFENTCPYRVY